MLTDTRHLRCACAPGALKCRNPGATKPNCVSGNNDLASAHSVNLVKISRRALSVVAGLIFGATFVDNLESTIDHIEG